MARENENQAWSPRAKVRFGVAVAGAALMSIGYNLDRDAHSRGILAERRKRWELYDEIGAGSFGVVRLGLCSSTGEMAAVKIVEPEQRNFDALRREIAALKLVKALGGHRNIIDLQDVYAEGRKVFLVTELVRGGELFDHLIAYGTFSEESAANVARDLGRALSFLHHHGIVHKDLKPENILLESRDHNCPQGVKLADFGSAGPPSTSDRIDDIGTSAYLPPELLKAGMCTTACDMWALGCVLYIMLSGAHPFDLEGSASDEEVEQRIKTGQVAFNYGVWTHISGEAKDLIARLLQKDPALRPSADEVLNHPWLKRCTTAVPLSKAMELQQNQVFHSLQGTDHSSTPIQTPLRP